MIRTREFLTFPLQGFFDRHVVCCLANGWAVDFWDLVSMRREKKNKKRHSAPAFWVVFRKREIVQKVNTCVAPFMLETDLDIQNP